MIYPLDTDLAHSKWLLEMKDACELLSLFIAIGPSLVLPARGILLALTLEKRKQSALVTQ
jgi:hypothetical protein